MEETQGHRAKKKNGLNEPQTPKIQLIPMPHKAREENIEKFI